MPGAMLKQVLSSVVRRPATLLYPFVKLVMPPRFRGKLHFKQSACIGCKLCMRDCPADAIQIRKVAEKTFEADIDMARCIGCAQCVDSCPKKALEMGLEFELASLKRSTLIETHRDKPAEAPTAPPTPADKAD